MRTKYGLFALLLVLINVTASAQTINTIAGTYYGDGQTAFAIGIVPQNQVVYPLGNIYFSEPSRHIVRKLSVNGIYSTVAGTGVFGYSGDGGPATAAQLKIPFSIAIDSIGNIYIADGTDYRIRKVAINGIITTIAGNGTYGFSGDGGPAIQAQLNTPNGVAVDGIGNVFITDFNNRRVRKVNTMGIITTFAGSGAFNDDGGGNGGPATAASLSSPISVAVNKAGEVFIADISLQNVRKVDVNGIITAFAGPVSSGNTGFSGDGGPATSALFNSVGGG